MISRIRAGVSPAFQNVCHCPRGLKIRSPGCATTTSSPSRAPTLPSITQLYSSSRLWRWSGAASARGDIGCSTSEKRSSASLPSIMNRTPMLPRKPDVPSAGPRTRAGAVTFIAGDSFHRTIVSREYTARRRICQYWCDSHGRPKASVPDEAARRARGADTAAHRRERSRAARGGGPRADVDQRDRGARGCPPFDRLPALPRRGRALRRLQRALACGEPGAGGRAVAGDRRPARAPEGGARGAVRLLPADGAHVREPPPRREDDAHGAADVRRLPGLPRGGRRGVDAWTAAPRRREEARARGDRTCARVPDVAVARARAGARRRRGRGPDVQVRRGRSRNAFGFLAPSLPRPGSTSGAMCARTLLAVLVGCLSLPGAALAASAPAAVTGAVTTFSDTSATVTGTVNPNGQTTTWHFDYGTSTSYGSSTPATAAGSGTANANVSATITGLVPGTTYHYRFVAANASGTTAGGDGVFTTSGTPAPAVVTAPASGLASTSATLNGSVNPNGRATTWYFEYGTSTAYGSRTPSQNAGAGTTAVNVSAPAGGLRTGVAYHFRLVATSNAGTTRGLDQSFVLRTAPAATTGSVSSLSATSAILNGAVNPNGQETSWHFEVGTTTSYGTATATKSAGSGTASANVSAALAGLVPGTTYHYRLVATSASGTTAGADRTFMTVGTP